MYYSSGQNLFYWVCNGFKLNKWDDFFESFLTNFETSIVFESDGAVVKIDLSLKLNHYNQF